MINKKAIKKLLSKQHKNVKLIQQYACKISFATRKKERKEIIICFDGIFSHGGLVDRLKGIISFYQIAKELDYDFKIRFDHPFALDVFLEPNDVNWKIAGSDIKFNSFSTQVVYLMDNFEANPLEIIQQSKAQTFLVYANIDYLSKIIPGKEEVEYQKIWFENFTTLFKKSSFLQEAISALPHPPYTVFHTRFTTLMGDFQDTTSHVLSENERQQLIQELLHKIQKSKDAEQADDSVFILSDSVVFLDYIKKNTSYSVLEGTPKHVDVKGEEASLESHLKTFSDFFFISNADKVYLLKVGKMYNSGFSKYAAIVGHKPFDVIS